MDRSGSGLVCRSSVAIGDAAFNPSWHLNAGFFLRPVGRRRHTSTDQLLGLTTSVIRDGYNRRHDLRAGVANNRIAPLANNGNWPNVIKFNRLTTNAVEQGQSTAVKFYYQWARPDTELATISLYFDTDFNPHNTNDILVCGLPVPGNGVGAVSHAITNVLLAASEVAREFTIFVRRSPPAVERAFFLYAPERVEALPIRQPPALAITQLDATQFEIVVNG